jgi:acetyl esterase/lipase
VFFFGGGWRSGSPTQFVEHCRYLASRGMVAMSAEYRILGLHETLAKACVEDGKSAVRWLRQHAKRLGVNPQQIAAGGGSAGAHVAACTGVVPGFDAADSVSSVPNALVLFNPPLVLAPVDGVRGIDPEKEKTLPGRMGVEPIALSPYHHVAKGQPPMLALHGEADTVVFIEGVRAFVAASNKLGNRCELAAYAGEGHGFFNFRRKPTPMYEATVKRMDDFLLSLGWLTQQ